ncbi:MAG: transcriptional regulator [Chitinophagia bacterium]|nr:transcriptional regulator [Chitinophagia bacterium]
MLSADEIKLLAADLENDRVEKTISKNKADKFGEAICAFANDLADRRLPGYLIVGVNDDGSIENIGVDEQLLQTLMSFRTDGRIVPPPSLQVQKFSFPEGDIAVVEVLPSYHPPVRYNGRVCIRIGGRRGYATEAEERILSEKRSSFAKSFDTLPCLGSSAQDLSIELFRLTYLPHAIDEQTLLENHRDIEQQLSSLKFYDLPKRCPTHAGVLMFGTNPRFYLPGAYIQYVRFQGIDEVSDFEYEQRFEGDLVTQLRVLKDFIKSQIIKTVQQDLGEGYIRNYVPSALEELLYNAVIHRDYQSNAPIKFYEFIDRIEITNPGGLYGDARPENFPNKNDYRNPALAEAAKNLGYINAFNVGVKRATAALLNNGNPNRNLSRIN